MRNKNRDKMKSENQNISQEVEKLTMMSFEKENIEQILEATRKLFQKLTGKNININDGYENSIYEDTKRNTINVSVNFSSDSAKTDFERFMARILYNSPTEAMTRRIPKLLKMLNLGEKNPYQKARKKDLAKQLAKETFQLFENRRCEFNFGQNYSGSNKRFKISRTERFVQQMALERKGFNFLTEKVNPKDPITALRLAEMDVDLSHTEFAYANDYIKKAEGLGRSGAVLLTQKYWEEYIAKWINDFVMPELPQSPQGQGGQNDDEDDEQEGQEGGEGEGQNDSEDYDDESEDSDIESDDDMDDDESEDGQEGQVGGINVGINPQGSGQSGEGQDMDLPEVENPHEGETQEQEGEGQSGEGNQEGNQSGEGQSGQSGQSPIDDIINEHSGQEGQDYEQTDSRPWRNDTHSSAQERLMKKLGFPEDKIYDDMTKGEASDIIEKLLKAEKEMEQLEREQRRKEQEQKQKELESDPDYQKEQEQFNELQSVDKYQEKLLDNMQMYKGKDEKLKVSKSLDKSREQGAKDIEALDDLILEKGLMEKPLKTNDDFNIDNFVRDVEYDDIKLQGMDVEEVKLDNMLVKKLHKFFKKFKGQSRDVLDEEGQFDMEGYVDSLKSAEKLCFTQSQEKSGLDILIAYDQSGSMGGERIRAVREVVGTLLKATQDNPKINVLGVGWSSGWGRSLRVEHIDDWKDVNKIRTTGTTPLYEAVIYSKSKLMEMNGNKKLLLFLTDGGPNGSGLVEQAKREVKKLQLRKNTAIGLVIGDRVNEPMRDLFGKSNAVSFDSGEEVANFIKNKVQKAIVRYLR